MVFSNLISNAFKYKPPERRLYIKVSAERKYDRFYIYFEDNGIGVPEKKIGEVFHIFATANNSISKGAGIGLYLVKESLKKIEADIQIQSTQNKGTRFTVDFPVI